MKTSLVITVLNEQKTINGLLESIDEQTLKPDEVIIADGGSLDETKKLILNFQKKSKLKLKLIEVKGNRSVGRNSAIRQARNDLILSTDAGCILDKNWVKNITKPFINPQADVVAGYYKGVSRSVFQKCLIPYVLVMPDRVDEKNFLPATRSMALKKTVWEKLGGFDHKLSNNEDYIFARKVKEQGFKIIFAKDAIVSWIPPDSLPKAFFMFLRFAYGDAEAGIIRPKIILVFARYFFGFFLLVLTGNIALALLALLAYCLWAVSKNYKYVNDQKALYILPALQFTTDLSVLIGTSIGLIKRF